MPTPKGLSVQPLYEQVRDLLVDRISKGIWKPGASLPNEQELAREFGISTGTVRKALHSMERDRLVVRQRGRGTFVVDQASGEPAIRFSNIRDATGRRVRGDLQLVNEKIDGANAAEQGPLRLQLGTPVLRTARLRFFEGRPFMYEETTIALDRFAGFDGTGAGGYHIAALAQQYGVHLSRASERISIVDATSKVAERLEIAPSTPVLKLDRVIFTLDEAAVEWRIGLCHLGEGQIYAADMS